MLALIKQSGGDPAAYIAPYNVDRWGKLTTIQLNEIRQKALEAIQAKAKQQGGQF